MKKMSLITIAILAMFASSIAQPIKKGGVIPKEFAGHWQKGVFSLSAFEQYDGKYIGPANETSVSYVIGEDGMAKEYFIANTNSYNCRMQVLGFRQGRILLNSTTNSFEFQPETGYYTTASCFSKVPVKKPYTAKELYPAYSVNGHFSKDENGTILLVTKRNDGSEGLVLKKVQ